MANTALTPFAGYGAYQLKATYQRNMLWALGTTTGLVTLMVALGGILLGTQNAPASSGPHSGDFVADTIKFHPIPPPTIERSRPDVRPSRPKPQKDNGSILRPVDDTSSTVEDPVLPYEPGDSSVGPVGDGGGSGEGDGAGVGTIDTVEYLPSIDSFVPVERDPVMIYSVQPEYPRWFKDAGIEGIVVIKALVGRKGDVLDAAVYVSSGIKLLDEAALAVAGKYKYQPAVQNGRPVAVWVTYKVDFKLSK